MIARVIALEGFEPSMRLARRCIDSAAGFGVTVGAHRACAPADDPEAFFRRNGWDDRAFRDNPYSKFLPSLAAFLSHASLWMMADRSGEGVLILEHDAVFVAPLPELDEIERAGCVCNLGRPSFGHFKIPVMGFGPLTSKSHLPGAHGYYVSAHAARALLAKAGREACPVDVYISRNRFGFLREFRPWTIEARDSFSTIQRERGCAAKLREVKPCPEF